MPDTAIYAFAKKNGIEGLTDESLNAIVTQVPGYTLDKAKRLLKFQDRINREMLRHRVITHNEYCTWFAQGKLRKEQVMAFVVQFSTFSNLFLIAQLKKTINADTLEGMHASKEILANEIGVVFNHNKPGAGRVADGVDPEIVSTEGTVEGGAFRFKAAHFEWLLHMAEKLGMGFNDIGKRHHGTQSTLFFCDELARLYGSEDYMTSQASSYAVENWAAAGFWDQLVEGFEKYNHQSGDALPLGFFVWHAKIEAQHAAHTQEELEELYFSRDIDEDKFIRDGNEMLNGVAAFWGGLEEQRKQLSK
jgi:pyrroloquinoline quinone (PQQ) biosynthesis protein C